MDRWQAAITTQCALLGKTCAMMQIHGLVQYFCNRIVSEDRRLSGKVRPSGVFPDFVWCVAFWICHVFSMR